MRQRFLASASVPVLAALFLTPVSPMAAQSSKPAAKTHTVRRMPDGHPDLQGTYDLATITPLERAAGSSLVMTKEEAARREIAYARERAKGDQPIEGNRAAPPKGGDGSPGAAGNVGGYNTGWLDPGSTYTVVDGQKRSGMIVDPPEGKVPVLTHTAAKRFAGFRGRTA